MKIPHQKGIYYEVDKLPLIAINPTLYHDIQVILSRLVAKASQLIDNVTTNLAESWMHIRSKFDGGKVINRSQSGSWEHHCMGAGLQQNMGTWTLEGTDALFSKSSICQHSKKLC